jgi:hypothetical protein
MMTQQDFQQLSVPIQREFTLNACIQLITLDIDQKVVMKLFYSSNGNVFIELYTTSESNTILDINSFDFNYYQLEKYLSDIDILSLFDKLNDSD